MRNLVKNILKYIKVLIIVAFIGLCNQISLTKAETKTMNENLNKTLDLNAMSIKLEELIRSDLYNPLDTYNGTLTGYAADCALCSGLLGCNGQNVLDRTISTVDSEYGEVRIVASSRNLPCGSIVQFDLPSVSQNKITAIVLDRGVIGTSLDLLVENEDYAFAYVGKKQITYDILRFGYQR